MKFRDSDTDVVVITSERGTSVPMKRLLDCRSANQTAALAGESAVERTPEDRRRAWRPKNMVALHRLDTDVPASSQMRR